MLKSEISKFQSKTKDLENDIESQKENYEDQIAQFKQKIQKMGVQIAEGKEE